MPFSLQDILHRAATHPIYAPLLPPHLQLKSTEGGTRKEQISSLALRSFKLIDKTHLIGTIEELIRTDPTFLHGAYLSPTGGTRGGPLLYMVTAVSDNRAQRQAAADMYAKFGVLEPTDIVMNLHNGVNAMYRSQNLSGDMIELSGATELSIGTLTPDKEVLELAKQFKANTIFAPSSRVVQFARYMSSLPPAERITIRKTLYTSEPFPVAQEVYVGEILGSEILSCMYGSAEAGPWACNIPRPIRKSVEEAVQGYSELLFSKKQMVVEIIDEEGEVLDDSITGGQLQEEGKKGEIVLTSLCRLRNPIVRYRTGDYGSLHPFGDGKDEYILLRFYGRSPNTSFFIDSEYIETSALDGRVFGKPEHDVLEWQVIISTFTDEELEREEEGTQADWLEFRIITKNNLLQKKEAYEEQVKQELVNQAFGKGGLKIVVKVVDYDGMIKGRVARKFIKIVDLRAK